MTDRKKNLIVTSGGKNVAPAPIENELVLSPYINQVMLVGDRRKFIGALIVPEFEKLRKYAARIGFSSATDSQLVKHPEVIGLYTREIAERSGDFARFEQVKKFVLLDRELTIEAGELTPTLKIRRKVVEEKYADSIDGLYSA